MQQPFGNYQSLLSEVNPPSGYCTQRSLAGLHQVEPNTVSTNTQGMFREQDLFYAQNAYHMYDFKQHINSNKAFALNSLSKAKLRKS